MLEELKYIVLGLGFGIGLGIFLNAYFSDFELKDIFSKYSSSMECEIEKKIELG